jgi:DNA-binding transcriptional LysR family regulator
MRPKARATDKTDAGTEPVTDGFLRTGLRFNHLRIMVALDDCGQVSTAAQILNISQPAASRMIAEIESVLAAPICQRLPRGIALTPYGKAFARRARSMLLELREAEREIEDLRTGQGGSVFVGTVAAPSITLAVPAIKRIRSLYPKLEINIQVDTSAILANDLLASRYDFIIGRIPDDLNPRLFETRLIGVERACLVVRRGHPLMRGGVVPVEELTAFDWVFQPSGSLLRRTLEVAFLSRGISLPDRILNTSSSFLTLVMVAQTDAIAPIAVDVADFVNAAEGLAGAIDVLPIDFEINLQPYSLITARNRALSPAAQMLYDFVVEQADRP